ncbi:MAG: hypothetical protein AAF206_25035 [Bacteroidota bacterium]
MNSIKKVVGINLLVLLVYSVIIHLASSDGYSLLFLLAMAIAIQTGINFLISMASFIGKQKEQGIAFIVATGVVLLVGFSSCFAGAEYFG